MTTQDPNAPITQRETFERLAASYRSSIASLDMDISKAAHQIESWTARLADLRAGRDSKTGDLRAVVARIRELEDDEIRRRREAEDAAV